MGTYVNPLGDKVEKILRSSPLTFTVKDIATQLGSTEDIVRGLINRRGVKNLVLSHKQATDNEFVKRNGGVIGRVMPTKGDVDVAKLKNDDVRDITKAEMNEEAAKEKRTLAERKLKLLQQDYRKLKREYDALHTHLDVSTKPIHIRSNNKKNMNEAVPCIVLSDWHVEEEVRPQTIGGKNKYNLQIAEKRAAKIFQGATKLIREKDDEVQINDVAVFLLGDFITGRIHDENVENALLLPLDALKFAQELIEGGIDYLLENTDKKMTIYCKVGNHSRITKRIHASTEWENSLEYALFWSLARVYENEPRIRFHIEQSYLSVVNILGFPIRYHHGHAVNYGGGIGGLHIPLRKAIQNWNQNERAVYDVMGHYHNFMEFTTPKYMVNGSLIGYSAYAERVKAVAEPAIQGFFLIHKKYGPTNFTPIFAE